MAWRARKLVIAIEDSIGRVLTDQPLVAALRTRVDRGVTRPRRWRSDQSAAPDAMRVEPSDRRRVLRRLWEI